jgi:hypothetical protein
MPVYKIIQGSFVDHDGKVKVEGETIELSEAFAADHAHEVVLVDDPAIDDAHHPDFPDSHAV